MEKLKSIAGSGPGDDNNDTADEKDVSNVPDDEERHPLTPEVASASHEETRLHASPEPIVGLKVIS